MVINPQHRFCYFAIPRTGSQATTKLLVEAFGSEIRMKMHSSYDEFMTVASEEETTYFSFCAVRHPLDSLVSRYFKIKNDHRGRFSRGTFLKTGKPIAPGAVEKFKFIRENDASFAEYFQRFHTEVYQIPRHQQTARQVDFVMKFERLQEDLTQVLQQLGLPPKEIPVYNTTKKEKVDYLAHYTPEIIPQAIVVTCALVQEWGYEYPLDWQRYL